MSAWSLPSGSNFDTVFEEYLDEQETKNDDVKEIETLDEKVRRKRDELLGDIFE